MQKKPQMHRVDFELDSGKEKQLHTVFLKHGQPLVDALKILEKKGVLEMTEANGFPYVIRINGQIAGQPSGESLPWYSDYGINPEMLNGKKGVGPEFWKIGAGGDRYVPVAEYEGKSYFLTFKDIIVTEDIRIGMGMNYGGTYEYVNGNAVLDHAGKDRIWTPEEIMKRIETDPFAFLTPVENMKLGWFVREDILNPDKKVLETRTRNEIEYRPLVVHYHTMLFRNEKKHFNFFDGLSPQYLQLRQKMVERPSLGAKEISLPLQAQTGRQGISEMQKPGEAMFGGRDIAPADFSSRALNAGIAQEAKFFQKPFSPEELKGWDDLFPPDCRQIQRKRGEASEKIAKKNKEGGIEATFSKSGCKEEMLALNFGVALQKETAEAKISSSSDEKVRNFEFENFALKTEELAENSALQMRANEKSAKISNAQEAHIKNYAKNKAAREEAIVGKNISNKLQNSQHKKEEAKAVEYAAGIKVPASEKITPRYFDVQKIQERELDAKKILQGEKKLKKDDKPPQTKERLKVKNSANIIKMQKEADGREERYAKIDNALAGAKKKKITDILRITPKRKRARLKGKDLISINAISAKKRYKKKSAA